jgi:Serine acetyltransferase
VISTALQRDHDTGWVLACTSARAHLAGEVEIGDRSWIGIGASVIQQIRIGADVIVGAGAAVVHDLPDGVTAVGVPARVRALV